MTTDRVVQALRELVRADRDQKCAAILAEAATRARKVRANAYADARARVRAAFSEERNHHAIRIAAAAADAATRRRAALQRRDAALVAAGWERLPAALERAWRDPASRLGWTERTGAVAVSTLLRGAWRIIHANGWPEDERARFSATLGAKGAVPEFVADSNVRAGLKIASGGNVLDATLGGLVADRTAIGALLLWELRARKATP